MEFGNGKSLKDYLVRAALLKMENAGGSQTCEEGTCQVCDHIITANTFIVKACGVVFEIQRTPLNWKGKTKFCFRFNNYKSKQRSSQKGK